MTDEALKPLNWTPAPDIGYNVVRRPDGGMQYTFTDLTHSTLLHWREFSLQPRATLMIVEHAERFGLAQLHQLRGRVGRGEGPGTCVVVARGVSEESEARLAALLETSDGFAIAEPDLRIRGPGEFLGSRQHGQLPDLRLADLVRDARLVSTAREAALATLRADPGLHRDPELLRAVEARWGDRLALAGVG